MAGRGCTGAWETFPPDNIWPTLILFRSEEDSNSKSRLSLRPLAEEAIGIPLLGSAAHRVAESSRLSKCGHINAKLDERKSGCFRVSRSKISIHL